VQSASPALQLPLQDRALSSPSQQFDNEHELASRLSGVSATPPYSNAGKSYAQIAVAINRQHGDGTTTPEAIRKILKSREGRRTPDKTQ
jgi:hypothetical protein